MKVTGWIIVNRGSSLSHYGSGKWRNSLVRSGFKQSTIYYDEELATYECSKLNYNPLRPLPVTNPPTIDTNWYTEDQHEVVEITFEVEEKK